MDNKHFIWIIPVILIIGFTLGFISGIKIPKDIKFGLDNETINIMDKYANLEALKLNSTEKLQNCSLKPQIIENNSSCDFDGVDNKKYSCCENNYIVTFHNSTDWLCEEDRWKDERII